MFNPAPIGDSISLTVWSVDILSLADTDERFLSFEQEDQDPRRMFRPIQFLLSLMNNQTMNNTIAEASRWRLVRSLEAFSWRVPALWCSIHDKAKDLLDQSSQLVRQRIAL